MSKQHKQIVSMSELDITIRNYAIIRQVWKLNENEIAWLDEYLLRKTTPFRFALSLDKYERKTVLPLGSMFYEIIPMNFIMTDLIDMEKESPNRPIILSFRRKILTKVVLARWAEQPNDQEILEYYK